MKAIILAGGEGTRLRPLTYQMPKAMIPVQGRTLTEHVFNIYKKIGVTEIYLSVAYLADKMIDYFGNGKKFGLKINYLKEENPRGTAGPLLILKEKGETVKDNFFMSNGDNLFALDLKAMLDFHQKSGGAATIALIEVSDPSRYGVARLNNSQILEFTEKPKIQEAPSNFISSGYYVLSPEIFDYLPNKDFVMMEKEVWPVLAKAGKLFGFKSAAQWFDTGTPQSYQQVEKEWQGI
ncbi:MAG TPA: NDP-sugar synthase [Patescibacteria group bacterium]|nr:NDP-sugar synthase [Patescibacteria group bacterium]